MMPVELTYEQKIAALSERFYLRVENSWQPKKGDYYTSTRNDLELYQIVDEDDDFFYTNYCKTPTPKPAQWAKDTFLRGFGYHRVHVRTDLLIQPTPKNEA